jgi:lipopolysaccharide export system permease protein
LLVRGDTGPKLIMFEGIAQNVTREGQRLSVTRFADFTYDLGGLLSVGDDSGRTMDELSTLALFQADPALLEETGASEADFLYEAHSRFATPLLATAAALIGFAALLIGAFSRFGLWRQIIFAVVLLILVQLVNTASAGIALRSAAMAPMAYAAPILGIAIGTALLWLAQRPRRIRGAMA